MTGGLLYGVGVALSSQADKGLWLLYLSYGVIGGIGLGFAYIIPIATLVKWFPDKRGLMTGVAVGGFGAGALVTAPIARSLIAKNGVLTTFLYLGIAFLLVCVVAGYFMENPPAGFRPEGWEPSPALQKREGARDFTLREALRSWQWWALWAAAVSKIPPQASGSFRRSLPFSRKSQASLRPRRQGWSESRPSAMAPAASSGPGCLT